MVGTGGYWAAVQQKQSGDLVGGCVGSAVRTIRIRIAPCKGATPYRRRPWVVRVQVNDDFGDQAGRDFIELGGAKQAKPQPGPEASVTKRPR